MRVKSRMERIMDGKLQGHRDVMQLESGMERQESQQLLHEA